MHRLGNWIGPMPDLVRPVIPDKHRFVLIPKIRPAYWEEQREKFASLYTSLSDGEKDLLTEGVEAGFGRVAA